MTDLIIQVLTKDNALNLKKRILKKAKIVVGRYSGTYGLKIPFRDWYSPDYTETSIKFLDIVKPHELNYLEYGRGWNCCEEVDLTELYPKNGSYVFNRVGIEFKKWIYFGREHVGNIYEVEDIKDIVTKNPIYKTGISKIWRRGLLEIPIMEIWEHKLRDILQDC